MYNTKRNATFPNSDVLNKMSLNCEGRLNKSPQGYITINVTNLLLRQSLCMPGRYTILFRLLVVTKTVNYTGCDSEIKNLVCTGPTGQFRWFSGNNSSQTCSGLYTPILLCRYSLSSIHKLSYEYDYASLRSAWCWGVQILTVRCFSGFGVFFGHPVQYTLTLIKSLC